MLLEVIGTAVSTAHTLYPAIGREALGIPTVTGVVGHLVAEVLTEPQFLRVDADLQEVLLDARHVVPKCFVGHQTLEHQNALMKDHGEGCRIQEITVFGVA